MSEREPSPEKSGKKGFRSYFAASEWASCDVRHGNLQDAREALESTIQRLGNPPALILLELARVLEKLGEKREAISYFTKALGELDRELSSPKIKVLDDFFKKSGLKNEGKNPVAINIQECTDAISRLSSAIKDENPSE